MANHCRLCQSGQDCFSIRLVDKTMDIHRTSCEQDDSGPRTRILYKFAPEPIQRLCRFYFCCKRMIFLKKIDLSTEFSPFTTTTILYKSFVKQQIRASSRPQKIEPGTFSDTRQTRSLAGKTAHHEVARQPAKSAFLPTLVDKRLHIHRTRCGKTPSLSTRIFLSQTHPTWIQCLCKLFCGS